MKEILGTTPFDATGMTEETWPQLDFVVFCHTPKCDAYQVPHNIHCYLNPDGILRAICGKCGENTHVFVNE